MNKNNRHENIFQRKIYNFLLRRISFMLKENDKSGIEQINNNKLRTFLSDSQLDMLDKEIDTAVFLIVGRLCNGSIAPMQLNDRNKRRSAYIYYLRYLRDVLYEENSALAEKLAFDVYKDIQKNRQITPKSFFDEQYFRVLLPEVISGVSEEKERNRILNQAKSKVD